MGESIDIPTEVTVNGTTYTQSEGNITLPDYAKIGTATTNQALSKIEYTTEVAIPTTPETGVEYAITDRKSTRLNSSHTS